MPLIEPLGAIEIPFGELALYIGIDEVVIAGPGFDPGACEVLGDASELREHVRFDDNGGYRPFSGLRNMPTNWHARFPTLEAFASALDAIYPLGQCHVSQHEAGDLKLTSLDELFQRQEGRYAVSANLSARGRALARQALCGVCVRVPLWAGEGTIADGAIPCPEPCSVMLSLCREAALWERERPAAASPDASLPFAAFDQPGNPLREAFLRALEPSRE